jgi:hypothetical protein
MARTGVDPKDEYLSYKHYVDIDYAATRSGIQFMVFWIQSLVIQSEI